MKPIRLALFLVLLIVHVILVVLSLNFTQSTADSIVRNPSAFRFLTFFGLVVSLITFAFAWFDRRAARRRIEKLEAEKNAIKAEVFDREKRAQEREQEIEREIKSFKASLPTNEPTTTEPILPEDSAESRLTESRLTESSSDEPVRDESHLAEPRPAEPRPAEPRLTEADASPSADPDQVEYGPLTPKHPPSDDNDTDHTPPPSRS